MFPLNNSFYRNRRSARSLLAPFHVSLFLLLHSSLVKNKFFARFNLRFLLFSLSLLFLLISRNQNTQSISPVRQGLPSYIYASYTFHFNLFYSGPYTWLHLLGGRNKKTPPAFRLQNASPGLLWTCQTCPAPAQDIIANYWGVVNCLPHLLIIYLPAV